MLALIFSLNLIQAFAKIEEVPYDFNCTAKINTQEIPKAQFEAIQRLSLPTEFDVMLWGDTDFSTALETSENLPKVIKAKKKTLAKQFAKKEKELRNLPVGKNKIWREARKRKLKQVRENFAFIKAQLDYLISGKSEKIEKIIAAQKIEGRCDRFVKPLKDVESLKTFAPLFIQEECGKNADVARCTQEMALNEKSSNSLAMFRFRVLNLGVFNCADYHSKKVWTDHEQNELKKMVRDVTCGTP